MANLSIRNVPEEVVAQLRGPRGIAEQILQTIDEYVEPLPELGS